MRGVLEMTIKVKTYTLELKIEPLAKYTCQPLKHVKTISLQINHKKKETKNLLIIQLILVSGCERMKRGINQFVFRCEFSFCKLEL